MNREKCFFLKLMNVKREILDEGVCGMNKGMKVI